MSEMFSRTFVFVPLIKSRPVPDSHYDYARGDLAKIRMLRLAHARKEREAAEGPPAWAITYWREGEDVWLECGAWGLIEVHDRHINRRLMGPGCWGKRSWMHDWAPDPVADAGWAN